MAWMITRDALAEDLELETNDTGVCGPRTITDTARDKLIDGKGHPFRMYDDDDILYYEGLLLGDKDGEQGFTPLDHFGTPNAGCTRIEYFNKKTGEWETL